MWDKALNIEAKKFSQDKANDQILAQLSFGSTVNVNENNLDSYIREGHQTNPTVFSIINSTLMMIGQVPWHVYRKKSDGTKEYADVPLLQALINKPNFRESWGQFIGNCVGYQMLTGNTFMWGLDPGKGSINEGKPQAMFALPSQNMQIWQSSKGPTQRISHYDLEVGKNDTKPIAANEVAHIRSFQPDYDTEGNFLFGQSPLRAAYGQLQTSNNAIITGQSYLDNQGPQALLTAKHGENTPSFNAEQAQQLKRQFRADNQGSQNAGGVLITPMEFNVLQTGMSAADIQLIEQYNLSNKDLCNVFNWPHLLLGIGAGTFDNYREAKLAAWEDVVIPQMMLIRDAFNMQFAGAFGRNICIDFDLSGVMVMQDRLIKQAEAIAKTQGIFTLNEARSALGKMPYNGPEGDQLLVTNRFDQSSNKPKGGDKKEETKPKEEDGSKE